MLKVLIKKQLSEVFRSYFYNAKKNRMRSKWAVAGWFVFFAVVMVGVLGGIFTGLSLSMCGGLTQAGMGWLYFLVMGGIAVALGAFGSVFNTYSGLYLSRDNDLLLSMPIPVRTIIAARLVNVYLMGTMYVATVMVPALIVCWVVAGASAARVIGGLLLFLIITAFVLLLSCLLGWVVARLSLKLKNKSILAAFMALLFFGGYYLVYFKVNSLIRDVVLNAEVYGAKIKGAAYALYLFGRIGEGDWMAAAIFLAVTAVLFAVVWRILSRSFLHIATTDGKTKKVRYAEKPVKEKTVFGALLGKEFARFTSSPNYMLNCGLGILLIPACGILFLVKGSMLSETINRVFAGKPDTAAILLCTVLCLVSAMDDMAAPSVSLEGKSLWIAQSLPVEPKAVLRAKAAVQLILTGLPMLFAAVCTALAVRTTVPVKVLLVAMPLVYSAVWAVFSAVIGVRMPLLSWTSELAPIKQSGAVVISMFGGWAVGVGLAVLYLLAGYRLGAALYLLLWTVLLAVAGILLLRWMDTKGAEAFASL